MIAPASDCRIVPSTETTATTIDPYVGNPRYGAPASGNQNKSVLPKMAIQMMLLKRWVKT